MKDNEIASPSEYKTFSRSLSTYRAGKQIPPSGTAKIRSMTSENLPRVTIEVVHVNTSAPCIDPMYEFWKIMADSEQNHEFGWDSPSVKAALATKPYMAKIAEKGNSFCVSWNGRMRAFVLLNLTSLDSRGT